MTMPEPQWEAATEAIHAAKKILIVTHVNPDGDAIGSALGLANALRAMGKKVTVCDDDRVPEFLSFLPGADKVNMKITYGKWDVMIATDAADAGRMGQAGIFGMERSKVVINLDHHVTNTRFGDIHLIVPESVAAAEIVFDWWQHAGVEITPEVATPLLTGLVTDTRGFRINSVKPRTLEVAQALMAAGASLFDVIANTLDSKPYRIIDLWKHTFPEVELDGGVIYACIQNDFFEKANVEDGGDGGLVSLLMQVNEANIAALFKEVPNKPGIIRMSFRCRPGFDVASVAEQIDGGGHTLAAGASFNGTCEEAIAHVLPLLKAEATRGSNA
ncbi:MAG: DHH family phosphoesterase [Aggregatilineales bacterium]